MQSVVFLTCFFSKVIEENLWRVGSTPLVNEGFKSVFGLVEVDGNRFINVVFDTMSLPSILLMCGRFGQCIDKEGWGSFLMQNLQLIK